MSKRWLGYALLIVIGYLAADNTAAHLERRLVLTSPSTSSTPLMHVPVGTATVGLANPSQLQAVLNNHHATPSPRIPTASASPAKAAQPGPAPVAPELPKLVGTMAGSGHSLAILQWGEETRVCGVGEAFGGCKIVEITAYSVLLKDSKGQNLVLQIGAATPTHSPSAAPVAPTTAAPRALVTPPADDTLSSAELRELIDGAAQKVSVKPFLRGGEVVGMRVIYSSLDNPLAKLGVRSGDVLLSFNGRTVKTPEDLYPCYQMLRNETTLSFALERNGQPVSFTVHVRER